MGNGIEANVAGIGIPASGIPVRYRSVPVPDWFRLQVAADAGVILGIWCRKIINEWQNAGMPVNKLVRHRHFYRQSNASVLHRHFGLRIRHCCWSALVQHCPALILWLPVSDYLTLGCHEEGGAVPLHQRLCGVDQRQAIRNSILNKCPIIY